MPRLKDLCAHTPVRESWECWGEVYLLPFEQKGMWKGNEHWAHLGQAFFSRLPPLQFIQMWPQQLKTVSKGLPSLTSAWASL